MVHLNPGIRFIKSTNDLMTLMYLFWSTLGGAKKTVQGAGIIDKEASGRSSCTGLFGKQFFTLMYHQYREEETQKGKALVQHIHGRAK